ncbi:MAG: heme A synthase [Bacteroidetes bacterium]|nr:MAG: heme A synthase [Bacteroidota bacterium]
MLGSYKNSQTIKQMNNAHPYPPAVRWWLLLGVLMVIGQVVIGGITRLTGSGLSITKWEIVTGTLPPLNAADWEEAFDLYKATPQYAKLNDGMSMSEFKFIYFWEYFHRLWARLMGLVFLIPFLIFWRRGWLDRPLMRRLGITVLLAAVVASFGWIMVASGLINRPWVNAYKLTMHLSLAFILYGYLLWTTFKVWQPHISRFPHPVLKTWAKWVTAVLALQIVLGGIVSGSRAALWFPSWPDMKGKWLPDVLLDSSMWTVENFVNYDATIFFPAFIQFAHRNIAYLLTIMVLYFAYRVYKTHFSTATTVGSILLVSMLILQLLLGISTLIYSVGVIPVGLGVLHQAGAIVLLSIVLFMDYQLLKE